jgi:hypothetical protein
MAVSEEQEERLKNKRRIRGAHIKRLLPLAG